MSKRTERTVWEVRRYDVWGNAADGWDVNDCYVIDDHLVLDLSVKAQQTGAPWDRKRGAYLYAEISEQHVREALSCQGERVDIDGNDVHVTVVRHRDGYPIGELICLTHESLSPLRAFDARPEDGLWEDWQLRVDATLRGDDK